MKIAILILLFTAKMAAQRVFIPVFAMCLLNDSTAFVDMRFADNRPEIGDSTIFMEVLSGEIKADPNLKTEYFNGYVAGNWAEMKAAIRDRRPVTLATYVWQPVILNNEIVTRRIWRTHKF